MTGGRTDIRAGAHAFEAKVFNIVSSAFADQSFKDIIAKGDNTIMDIIERSPRGVSMILDPSGNIVGDTMSDREGILYADIDTSMSVEPKQFHDVTGYYNRFDIFDLKVDRSRRDPARFMGSAEQGRKNGQPQSGEFDIAGASHHRELETIA